MLREIGEAETLFPDFYETKIPKTTLCCSTRIELENNNIIEYITGSTSNINTSLVGWPRSVRKDEVCLLCTYI